MTKIVAKNWGQIHAPCEIKSWILRRMMKMMYNLNITAASRVIILTRNSWYFYTCVLLRASEIYQIQRHTKTRNLSGDEMAKVNILYDDIVHALQNTIGSCINSATDRRGYVLEPRFTTKCSKITQYNAPFKVSQCHSRSQILVPIESSYTTSY